MIDNDFYCMDFSNEEVENFFIRHIKENTQKDIDIKMYSEEYKEISFNCAERINVITFDDEENIVIEFEKSKTSIFVFNEEIMFIDEKAKRYSYTTNDIYGNVVYEGKIRDLTHKQMLNMFAEIILCVLEATSITIVDEDITNDEYENAYYYIETLKQYNIYVENQNSFQKNKIFKNINIYF